MVKRIGIFLSVLVLSLLFVLPASAYNTSDTIQTWGLTMQDFRALLSDRSSIGQDALYFYGDGGNPYFVFFSGYGTGVASYSWSLGNGYFGLKPYNRYDFTYSFSVFKYDRVTKRLSLVDSGQHTQSESVLIPTETVGIIYGTRLRPSPVPTPHGWGDIDYETFFPSPLTWQEAAEGGVGNLMIHFGDSLVILLGVGLIVLAVLLAPYLIRRLVGWSM